MPHWLLNFEESVELFVGQTEHVATSQTNILKDAMLVARRAFATPGIPAGKITVDTPVPYKLSALIADIEVRGVTRIDTALLQVLGRSAPI